MKKFTDRLSSFCNRQNLLVAGTLLLAVSSFLPVALYSLAALITLYECRKEVFANKERAAVAGSILVISLWMIFRKIGPENLDPGIVALSDYFPFYVFLFVLSLRPFTDSESEKFSYALTFTVPQHFLFAIMEKYAGLQGGISFPKGKVHLVQVVLGGVTAGFYNRNILGLYCVIGAAVSLSLFLKEMEKIKEPGLAMTRPAWRLAWTGISFVLSTILLVWSNSRNGWFAFVFVVMAFMWFNRRILIFKILVFLLPVLAASVVVNLGFMTNLMEMLLPGSIVSRLNSDVILSGDRSEIYQCAVEIIQEKPIAGWGIGAFKAECSSRIGHWVPHAHNMLLQLGADIGVPAAVLVICLIGYFIGRAIYGVNKPAYYHHWSSIQDKGFLVAVIAVILLQVFDLALFMTYRLNFLFWILLAIPYSRAVNKLNISGP